VADEAATALRAHQASNAAVELHLADQLLMPLALATGASAFTVARPTGHLVTNARIIAEFGVADIVIEPGKPNEVRVQPRRRR
jgi:RNA 3'-terminal phosphate cyclase (ATP)